MLVKAISDGGAVDLHRRTASSLSPISDTMPISPFQRAAYEPVSEGHWDSPATPDPMLISPRVDHAIVAEHMNLQAIHRQAQQQPQLAELQVLAQTQYVTHQRRVSDAQGLLQRHRMETTNAYASAVYQAQQQQPQQQQRVSVDLQQLIRSSPRDAPAYSLHPGKAAEMRPPPPPGPMLGQGGPPLQIDFPSSNPTAALGSGGPGSCGRAYAIPGANPALEAGAAMNNNANSPLNPSLAALRMGLHRTGSAPSTFPTVAQILSGITQAFQCLLCRSMQQC